MPRFLVVVFVFALMALPSSAVAGVTVGIGEQKASMFADPRFQALDVKIVRANVRWDVMSNPRLLGELDAWMAAARCRHPAAADL